MKKTQDIPTVSNKSLLVATVSALILALFIYLIVVLPAEYGKDPTGLGEKLGLTVLTAETLSEDIPVVEIMPVESTEFVFREDDELVIVPANKGIEYKFELNAFDQLIYEWQTTDGSAIYFDFHGEPEGDTTGYFLSYSIATANQVQGTATVPFKGIHGWYWKNTTDQPISIQLKTSGNYRVSGHK